MKILEIDYDYYYYPEDCRCIEDFIRYVNEHYNTFICLTRFETENCTFPYLISEETKQIYVNVAAIEKINEEDATVLSRSDYDSRLEQAVKNKCTDCIHYQEDLQGDNLRGHRGKISLDGECWGYEKKE